MTTWPGTSSPKSTGNAYPPAGYLRECFQYEPDTGVLTWRIRPDNHFHSVGIARRFARLVQRVFLFCKQHDLEARQASAFRPGKDSAGRSQSDGNAMDDKPTSRPWCLRERPAHGAGAAGAALQPEAAGRDPAGIGDGSGAGAAARAQRPLDAVRGDHRAHGVHGEGGELGAGVPVGGAVDRAVELGRAQPEVSALPGDDEVTPRFVFVKPEAA